MSPDTVIVAAVKKHATVIVEVGGKNTDIMLDSGSSVSLVRRDLLHHIQDAVKLPVPS